MLVITHALPKNLQVDEIVQVGLSRAEPLGELAAQALGVVGHPA